MTSLRQVADDIAAKLQAFSDINLPHPKQEAALERCKRLTLAPGHCRVVLVVGPAGVGKSMLSRILMAWLLTGSVEEVRDNPAHLPALKVTAKAPVNGVFGWKHFFEQLLNAAQEILVEYKVAFEPPGWWPKSASLRTFALLESYHQVLFFRRPLAVLIDEAHHIAIGARNRESRLQIECVKTLARESATVHFLFATHDVIKLLDVSEQVARSAQIVHLDPYDAADIEERRQFMEFTIKLIRALPIPLASSQRRRYAYFHKQSCGAPGILHDWFELAAGCALLDGAAEITAARLEESAILQRQLDTLKEAIKGHGDALSRTAALREQAESALRPTPPAKSTKAKPPYYARRPFERNPLRDLLPPEAA